MVNNTISSLQANEISELNRQMTSHLESLTSQDTLRAAMNYSVMAGGKRIRPLIVFATCASFQSPISESAYAVAGSLEFIHTYSLIHDDLPEMDNDDLRRGKPTNHKVYGQAMAVLAGDALLTEAFAWLAQAKVSTSANLKLVEKLAQAAGPTGMIAGQARDIESEGQRLSLQQLKTLHAGKTGALVQYAFEAGGILAGVSEQQNRLLRQFGSFFGLAFQIYDDILDETSTAEEMGKAVHKDRFEHKNTYPSLLGLDGAKQALNETLAKAKDVLEQLKNLDVRPELFDELLGYFKI